MAVARHNHMLGSMHGVDAFGQHILFAVGVHWLVGNCSLHGTTFYGLAVWRRTARSIILQKIFFFNLYIFFLSLIFNLNNFFFHIRIENSWG